MRLKPGATGWFAVGAVVIAAELLDAKTMSEGFRDLYGTPRGRYALAIGWSVLTAHLFGYIPSKYDPLHQLWVHARRENARGIDQAVQLLLEEA